MAAKRKVPGDPDRDAQFDVAFPLFSTIRVTVESTQPLPDAFPV